MDFLFSHGPNFHLWLNQGAHLKFQSSNFHLYGFSFSIPRSSPSLVPPALVLFFSLTSPSEISKFKLPFPRIFSLHHTVLTGVGAISPSEISKFKLSSPRIFSLHPTALSVASATSHCAKSPLLRGLCLTPT